MQTTRHATCVASHGNGALIVGASGSGKSSLALAMMAYGADLVADDQVILRTDQSHIMASAPTAIDGLIEAWGIGLLRAITVTDARIKLVIDLDQIEHIRLPPIRFTMVMGQSVPLLYKVDTPHFPAAVMQYLACGRQSV
ncbi:MAG: HPr kinase/phosphatase C-terminal domain-containing protein [Rhodobacteraceae bacterium]|nr:HPr kinase/phosphatase C-terminal domain-containing protein [Paracoccaceae bacterium]